MDSIFSKDSVVHFSETGYTAFNAHLGQNNYSKVFIIVDSNTHNFCLGLFLSKVELDGENIEIIEFPAGEEFKTIETCHQIWLALSELEADRKGLIINLGGGVVTDLGGFIACTYKRGVDYINIPTSLLAMVDASVGGKTGVDLGSLKNQVGVISNGLMVLIDTNYLETLPKSQMRSGLAEMLKHGLISNRNYWDRLKSLKTLNWNDLESLIYESVEIKNTVVTEDPKELGLRKSLNFGHTLGHAIESYFLDSDSKQDLLHGEAIAIGMILESFLSFKLNSLSETDLSDIKTHISNIYDSVNFTEEDVTQIIELLKHDKKNSHGKVKFALLHELGRPQLDCIVDNSIIRDAFDFYTN